MPKSPSKRKRVTDKERLDWLLENCVIYENSYDRDDPPMIQNRKELDTALSGQRGEKG